MNNLTAVEQKKIRNLQKLTERYYGKRDLLATWDELPEVIDLTYRNDLKRRVNAHKNDLIYRGTNPEDIL